VTERIDSPGVRFPPPLLFVAGFVGGLALDRWVYGLPLAGVSAIRPILATLGWLFAGAAFALIGWAFATFGRARTSIIPHQPASQLVRAGPYRYTRNPMYVSLVLLYTGVALIFDRAWPLLVLPLVVMTLHVLVIAREEAYLARAFGDAYVAYTREVRRWL
jgi:protein-S-isoprenylcysteine O-methyltransferase Ste14